MTEVTDHTEERSNGGFFSKEVETPLPRFSV